MFLNYQPSYDLKANTFNFAWTYWNGVFKYSFHHGSTYNADLYRKTFLKILVVFKVDTLLMYCYEEIDAPDTHTYTNTLTLTHTHTHTHTHSYTLTPLISTKGKKKPTLVFMIIQAIKSINNKIYFAAFIIHHLWV